MAYKLLFLFYNKSGLFWASFYSGKLAKLGKLR